MKKLPVHDAQILYIGLRPVSDDMDCILLRGEDSKYFLLRIKIYGLKSIVSSNNEDLGYIFDSGGGVYSANIDKIDDAIEILEIDGGSWTNDYWKMTIKSKRIDYVEYSISESKANELLKNFRCITEIDKLILQ